MNLQLVSNRGENQSAWTKAPADVAIIAEKIGYSAIRVPRFRMGTFSIIRRILRKLRLECAIDRLSWCAEFCLFLRKLNQGDVLLIQHPLPGTLTSDIRNIQDFFLLKKRGIKIYVLVHDIVYLQKGLRDAITKHRDECLIFELADRLIVHNTVMAHWVRENINPPCIIKNLEIFDYIVDESVQPTKREYGKDVVVAGSLGEKMSGFLSKIREIPQIHWRLYGNGYYANKFLGDNVSYCGTFQAEFGPSAIKGSWGLVWGGDDTVTCSGIIGHYLKYCNNHKLSLYMVSRLPVIVWRGAAIATFVKEHDVGLVVESLYDVPTMISQITSERYAELLANCEKIGTLLQNGFYTRKALSNV